MKTIHPMFNGSSRLRWRLLGLVVASSVLLVSACKVSQPPLEKKAGGCDIIAGATTLEGRGLADDGDDVGNQAGEEYGPRTANPLARQATDGRARAISAPVDFDELDARVSVAADSTATRIPRTRATSRATSSFTVLVGGQCILRIDSFARMVRLEGAELEYTVEAVIRQGPTVIASARATYQFAKERAPGAGIAILRNNGPLPFVIRNPSRFPVNGVQSDPSTPFTLAAGPTYTLEFMLHVSGVAFRFDPGPPIRASSGFLDVNAMLVILEVF